MKPSFIFLPLSNEKYSYMLLLDTGEIIEYENGKEITKLGDYGLFKQYYLKLNQRVCIPDEIEGFFSPNELAKNYLADQDKILNIENHIDDYLAVLQENLSIKIDKSRLGEGTYILKFLKKLEKKFLMMALRNMKFPLSFYMESISESYAHRKNGVWSEIIMCWGRSITILHLRMKILEIMCGKCYIMRGMIKYLTSNICWIWQR